MKLNRTRQASAVIRLVPMIDVLMILLVFFMVTSTWLNLRMIPLAAQADAPAPARAGPAPSASTLLIRLDAAGQALLRGQPIAANALAELLRSRREADPALSVVLLPSGQASNQDLVSLLEITTEAGIERLRIVRMGEAQ